MKGLIYLEDGSIYKGKGFGAGKTNVGELVFNTAMTGYQKTLTDPSYSGQVITLTFPLLGNYGINEEDYESERIHALGAVCQDLCTKPSNHRSAKTIDQWFCEQGIPGVYGVDTREMTRKLRRTGSQKCVITTEDLAVSDLRRLIAETTLSQDQMKTAGVKEITEWNTPDSDFHVAVLDFGVKRSILKELAARGCSMTIYPYGTKAKTILAAKPDGVFLTNGPGDPAAADEAVSIIEKLITNSNYGPDSMPIFGICMGHQLIALASGGSTYKMRSSRLQSWCIRQEHRQKLHYEPKSRLCGTIREHRLKRSGSDSFKSERWYGGRHVPFIKTCLFCAVSPGIQPRS